MTQPSDDRAEIVENVKAAPEVERLREALKWAVSFIQCNNPRECEHYPDYHNAVDLVNGASMNGPFYAALAAYELEAEDKRKAHARVAERDAEVERLRTLCRQQSDEIEKLTDMADAVEVLREIGKLIGCGHVDGPDERRQLVNCLDQHLDTLTAQLRAAEQERDRKSRACEIFEKNSAFATEMWEALAAIYHVGMDRNYLKSRGWEFHPHGRLWQHEKAEKRGYTTVEAVGFEIRHVFEKEKPEDATTALRERAERAEGEMAKMRERTVQERSGEAYGMKWQLHHIYGTWTISINDAVSGQSEVMLTLSDAAESMARWCRIAADAREERRQAAAECEKQIDAMFPTPTPAAQEGE